LLDDDANAAVSEAAAATADDRTTEPDAADAAAGAHAAVADVAAPSFDADALATELLAEFDRETAAAATPPAPVVPVPDAPAAAAPAAGARATAAPKFELPESFAPVPPPRSFREPTAPALRAKDTRARGVAHPGRWLRVCVDADRYAIELLRVQEVVRVAPVVGMRGADPAVLGVMNLRGRIVPVFDLGLWLGTTAVRPDEHSRIVVVERDDDLIGLLVTAVNDVTTLAADHIEPPFGSGHAGAIIGVARADEAPTVLLDANWLFD
jgi:purine-binding chemotaxis protein CheW